MPKVYSGLSYPREVVERQSLAAVVRPEDTRQTDSVFKTESVYNANFKPIPSSNEASTGRKTLSGTFALK